jgi:hypothetical protein
VVLTSDAAELCAHAEHATGVAIERVEIRLREGSPWGLMCLVCEAEDGTLDYYLRVRIVAR